MEKYCFGVDLGGTTVKIGLFTANGEMIEKWEIVTRKENNGKNILSDIALSIADKMNHREIAKGNVIGIGIGVPGPVVNETTVIGCVNLGWGFAEVNVAKILTGMTDLPCKVANDANVAALGEQWQGGGKGYKNCVMLTLGTGVGGGVISGGKIVAGANGAAGELGHMNVVDPQDVKGACNCGHVGCLEQAASATGLVNLAKIYLERSELESVLRGKELTAKDVLDAAKMGDELAVQITERMFMYLGKACAQISCVFNPDVFIIGGGVSRAGSYLINGIQRHYQDYAFHASTGTPFNLATLGNDAGMAGAAKLICEL